MNKTILTVILSLFISQAARADGVVLANQATGIEHITFKELRKIYKGRITIWSNGVAVSACYLDASNQEMDYFYKSILRQTPDKFNRYWAKKLFSGGGVAPKKFENNQRLLEVVASNNGGICYTDKAPDVLPGNVIVVDVR